MKLIRAFMPYSIGKFVKEKRAKLKLTQPQLAERTGVGLRFLRELEQGKESLQLNKVNQVLAFFGHELGPVKKSFAIRQDLTTKR